MKNRVRIVIADDHAIVREGIKNLVELEPNFEVVGLAESGRGAIKLCKELTPDVLLLDINMPRMNGVEVLKRIFKQSIDTKVIVLTIHNEKAYLVETVALGVKGYVLKEADFDILIDAINTVNSGDIYIYPSMRKYMDRSTKKKILAGYTEVIELLTGREIEVLKLISDGASNRAIGKSLYISEKTVKNHVSSIFKKIGVNDRTSATLYAIKKGIKRV